MTINTLTATLRQETDRGVITARLQDIADARVDIVAPQRSLLFRHADNTTTPPYRATLQPVSPIIAPSGVWGDRISVEVTRTAFRNLAERLGVPLSYLDRLTKDEYQELVVYTLDWLARRDTRAACFRFLNVGDAWLLRAVASNGYRPIDNLDLIVAVANGMTQAGLDLGGCDVEADWTMDRFRMRIAVPQVELALPEMLGNYRMPFTLDQQRAVHAPPAEGELPPVLWAGIEVSNSETGGGAAVMGPRAVVLRCRNGLVHTADNIRQVHAGQRLEEGVIDWSDETRRLSLDLLTSQIADAARRFCSVEYLQGFADRMKTAAGVQVDSVTETMRVVTANLLFSEAETRAVLDCFIRGGDRSVLGVGQAVTAAAQLAESTDRQAEMEATFWQIVDHPSTYAGVV